MRQSGNRLVRGTLGIVLLLLTTGMVPTAGAWGALANHAPVLKSPQVSPYNCCDRAQYRFSVLYQDADCDLPRTIQVTVDGQTYDLRPSSRSGRKFNMVYVSPKISFEPGPHKYYFTCEDAQGMTDRSPRYGEWTGPYVSDRKCRKHFNSWPELAEGHIVQGEDGDIETYFTFSVKFSDYDSTPPQFVEVVIDGLRHAMKLHKGNPWNGQYIYNVYLDTPPHGFWFRARDAKGAEITFPEKDFVSGPAVYDLPNANPELTDMKVDPLIGGTRDAYTFKVRYHDLDRDPPAVIQVYINGFPHNMKLAGGKKYDGIYSYRTSFIPSYWHSYSFRAEDGRGGEVIEPFQGTSAGPVVVDQQ